MVFSTQGWTLDALLSKGANLRPVPTIDAQSLAFEDLEQLIKDHEESGIPLVMKNWHLRDGWNDELFSPEWLAARYGKEKIRVRNLYDREDADSTLKEYLDYARGVSSHPNSEETHSLYAKDLLCPVEWADWLSASLPSWSLPNSLGDVGVHLPTNLRIETLMTYIGPGNTYTPAHKDSSASIGQNLMVHSRSSSWWFLTPSTSANLASAYWRHLGHELDLESYLATVEEWAAAPFEVYVCEQKKGDMILVPGRSCHQVINTGFTAKIAWSRMTPWSLGVALREELPIYQRVARPEIYRVKLTLSYFLTNYVELLTKRAASKATDPDWKTKVRVVADMLPHYRRMVYEVYDPSHESFDIFDFEGEMCDFCGACLWFGAMICRSCILPQSPKHHDKGRDINEEIDGRSCGCKIMKPIITQSFSTLLDLEERAVKLLNDGLEEKETPLNASVDRGLTSEFVPPYLRVANWLYRTRTGSLEAGSFNATRICNVYRNSNSCRHPFHLDSGLWCKGCHTSQCYTHILERYGIHLFEIVVASSSYQSHFTKLSLPKRRLQGKAVDVETYHSMHQHRERKESIPDFEGKWREWMPFLAWNFYPVKGFNSELLLGWYDRKDEQLSLPIDDIPAHVGNKRQVAGQEGDEEEEALDDEWTPRRKEAKRKASFQQQRKTKKRKNVPTSNRPSLQTEVTPPPESILRTTTKKRTILRRPRQPSATSSEVCSFLSNISPPVLASPAQSNRVHTLSPTNSLPIATSTDKHNSDHKVALLIERIEELERLRALDKEEIKDLKADVSWLKSLMRDEKMQESADEAGEAGERKKSS